MDEIKKIMSDCKKAGIKILNPDINESNNKFTVNKDGNIRFGLGGIKGFGSNAVQAIINDRDENGNFSDIYDFSERMAGVVNRKGLEALIFSGCFDSFGYSRSQFFIPSNSGETFTDLLFKYIEIYKKSNSSSQASLFGEVEELKPNRPAIPQKPDEENTLELLTREKELVGMYLSSHPLDKYSFEIENIATHSIGELDNLILEAQSSKKTLKVLLACYISSVNILNNKAGKPWSKTIIEDFNGHYEIALFGKDHEEHLKYLQTNQSLFIEGKIAEKYYIKPEDRKTKGDSPYTLKISKIRLLGNIATDYISDISLTLYSDKIDKHFRKALIDILKKYHGSTKLIINLIDYKSKYIIPFYSRKYMVTPCNELLYALNSLSIKYQINKVIPK